MALFGTVLSGRLNTKLYCRQLPRAAFCFKTIKGKNKLPFTVWSKAQHKKCQEEKMPVPVLPMCVSWTSSSVGARWTFIFIFLLNGRKLPKYIRRRIRASCFLLVLWWEHCQAKPYAEFPGNFTLKSQLLDFPHLGSSPWKGYSYLGISSMQNCCTGKLAPVYSNAALHSSLCWFFGLFCGLLGFFLLLLLLWFCFVGFVVVAAVGLFPPPLSWDAWWAGHVSKAGLQSTLGNPKCALTKAGRDGCSWYQ